MPEHALTFWPCLYAVFDHCDHLVQPRRLPGWLPASYAGCAICVKASKQSILPYFDTFYIRAFCKFDGQRCQLVQSAQLCRLLVLENLKGHEAGEGPQRERYAVQNSGGKHNLGQLVTRQRVSNSFGLFQAHPNTAGEIQGQTLAVWIQCSAKREGARRLEADLQELQKLSCKAWHNIWSWINV